MRWCSACCMIRGKLIDGRNVNGMSNENFSNSQCSRITKVFLPLQRGTDILNVDEVAQSYNPITINPTT